MLKKSILKKHSEFLAKIKEIHKDKYDYTLCHYIKKSEKVTLRCYLHGEFCKNPTDLLRGQGCQKCSSDRFIRTQENFVKLSTDKHQGFYSYEKTVYDNPYSTVEITCPIHGSFWQKPYNHTIGQGCEMCARQIKADAKRRTLDEFIIKSREIHGDTYDYSQVDYKNSLEKVNIICHKHGLFSQNANSHILGNGCPFCAKEKQSLTKEEFIERSNLIHNYKYNYDLVFYINQHTNITISCPVHGLFTQRPQTHLRGGGCKICGYKKQSKSARKTTEQFIKEAFLIHKDKYNYNLTNYELANKHVIIICPIHGQFKQTPDSHLRGSGCKKCLYSKGEKEVSRILNSYNIKYYSQHRFLECRDKFPLIFDFYIPDYGVIIEYDGLQHFKETPFWGGKMGLKNYQRKDKIKNKFCRKKGLKLIRIRYDENIYKVLHEEFLNLI